ncbi:MAG: fibronectin type III domain-containing protein [Fimbriimonadaceae bacterium]
MAKNSFHGTPIPNLVTLASQLITTIGVSPSTFGATAAQVTSITAARDALSTAAAAKANAYLAAKAATQGQDTAKDALIDQITVLAKQVYAKGGLTPQQIQSTGLAVHDTSPTKITPLVPTNLVAQAFANGDVNLSWDRNGNPYGVTFFIEASVDGNTWTQVFSTKRKSVKLANFAPGVPTNFRLYAWSNNESSSYSTTAWIYNSESSPSASLRLAA